jgi:hypothetical protein
MRSATVSSDPLSAAMSRLYACAFEDFIALRKQIAGELKAAGQAEGAKAIAAAPKPTRTAWALNQVGRRQPELPRALLLARDEAFAPSAGDAEGLRRARREYRERINDIVRAARDLLAEGDIELNASQARRLTETLQAACAEEGDTRAQLLSGTLARDAEAEDPLALLAPGPATEPRPVPSGAKRGPDPAVERKREQERRDRARGRRPRLARPGAHDSNRSRPRRARGRPCPARRRRGRGPARRGTREAREARSRRRVASSYRPAPPSDEDRASR